MLSPFQAELNHGGFIAMDGCHQRCVYLSLMCCFCRRGQGCIKVVTLATDLKLRSWQTLYMCLPCRERQGRSLLCTRLGRCQAITRFEMQMAHSGKLVGTDDINKRK